VSLNRGMWSRWEVESGRHVVRSKKAILPTDHIETLIQVMRGQRVIIDEDLARIYGVPTKALNQAIKRNLDRFPPDFLFQLNLKEAEWIRGLRSQIVTLKRGQHRKYLPYAFTEHGAMMAAN